MYLVKAVGRASNGQDLVAAKVAATGTGTGTGVSDGQGEGRRLWYGQGLW